LPDVKFGSEFPFRLEKKRRGTGNRPWKSGSVFQKTEKGEKRKKVFGSARSFDGKNFTQKRRGRGKDRGRGTSPSKKGP